MSTKGHDFISGHISGIQPAICPVFNDGRTQSHQRNLGICHFWLEYGADSRKIISTIAPQLNIKANYDLEEQRRNRIIEAAYGR